jgi:hypothetical protein
MAKVSDVWTVHPHGPLEKLAENLWHCWGSVPGMSLKRAMTLTRMKDGRVIIHNAISMDEDSMKEIESWGKLTFLVVPNGLHRMDAPSWKKRFPELKVVAPKGSRKKVEECVPVDLVYEEFEGDDSVGLQLLDGVKESEGAMTVRSSDGTTVVLNDAVFNMDMPTDFMGKMICTAFGSAPGPRVSRLGKLLLVNDKQALKENLARFAALPDLIRLIVSHDKVAKGPEAKAALDQAMTYL